MCSASVMGVTPNHALDGVIDLFLTMNPECKPKAEDLKKLDAEADELDVRVTTLPIDPVVPPDGTPHTVAEARGSSGENVSSQSSAAERRVEPQRPLRVRPGPSEEQMMSAMDDNSQTPLHLASRNGHVGVARALVEAGANREVHTNEGFTPLHLAAQEGHKAVVEMLIEAGANMRCRSSTGMSPLHSAVAGGHEEVVRALVQELPAPAHHPRRYRFPGRSNTAEWLRSSIFSRTAGWGEQGS